MSHVIICTDALHCTWYCFLKLRINFPFVTTGICYDNEIIQGERISFDKFPYGYKISQCLISQIIKVLLLIQSVACLWVILKIWSNSTFKFFFGCFFKIFENFVYWNIRFYLFIFYYNGVWSINLMLYEVLIIMSTFSHKTQMWYHAQFERVTQGGSHLCSYDIYILRKPYDRVPNDVI